MIHAPRIKDVRLAEPRITNARCRGTEGKTGNVLRLDFAMGSIAKPGPSALQEISSDFNKIRETRVRLNRPILKEVFLKGTHRRVCWFRPSSTPLPEIGGLAFALSPPTGPLGVGLGGR